MKVLIITSCQRNNAEYELGETVTVSENIGNDLIGQGFAEDAAEEEDDAERSTQEPG